MVLSTKHYIKVPYRTDMPRADFALILNFCRSFTSYRHLNMESFI